MIQNLSLENLNKQELDDLIYQMAENVAAMMTIITGEGAENFLRYSDMVQVDYLETIRQQTNLLKKAIKERHGL